MIVLQKLYLCDFHNLTITFLMVYNRVRKNFLACCTEAKAFFYTSEI